MNLLFITRIVDLQDTRSGFVFDWIKVFADEVERLYIICQEAGDVDGLPANVGIRSFWKEKGKGPP